jgi:quercetin dioxygenase-like cupin family protein
VGSALAQASESGHSSGAKPAAPVGRKALLTAVMNGASPVGRVQIMEIEFKPSQRTGFYRRPCAVVGYVADGAISFQIEGEPAKTLRRGDAFYEPMNARVAHFDNASETAPAKFIAFYLLSPGEDQLIEMLVQDWAKTDARNLNLASKIRAVPLLQRAFAPSTPTFVVLGLRQADQEFDIASIARPSSSTFHHRDGPRRG